MSWRVYRLVYRLQSPLHVGARQFGTIHLTRYYLPGRNLWGAITARLTQAYRRPAGAKDYREVGEWVREHCRTGYFYPMVGEKLFIPRYKADRGEWRYGDLNEFEFEAQFITSVASTAITHDSRTAEEGSLHEIECLSPFVQAGTLASQPVSLCGYLYLDLDHPFQTSVNAPLKPSDLLDLIRKIQVGGEQRYGLGRLWLNDIEECVPCEGEHPTPIDCEPEDDTATYYLRAHLRCCPCAKPYVLGPVEPLVGREWEAGPGLGLSAPIIGWVPGSQLSQSLPLHVGPYGVWEADPLPENS